MAEMNVLVVGGFDLAMEWWAIARGFQGAGCNVEFWPSRGVIEQCAERDAKFAVQEARMYKPELLTRFQFATEKEFAMALLAKAADFDLLVWPYPKDDCPDGCVKHMPCKTLFFSGDCLGVGPIPDNAMEFEYGLITNERDAKAYRAAGVNVKYTWFPIDAQQCRAAQPLPEETCDVMFSPSWVYRPGDVPEMAVDRVALIEALLDWSARDGWSLNLYGAWNEKPSDLGTLNGKNAPLARAYRGWRQYEDLPRVYRSANIVLNHHACAEHEGYHNSRDTMITACGAFMLSDWSSGLPKLFQVSDEDSAPRGEIEIWHSLTELRDKINWWLEHFVKRMMVADRAKAKALEKYNAVTWAKGVLEWLKQ